MPLSSEPEQRTAHPDLEDLLLLQSGELGSDESSRLQRHLERCPSCRDRLGTAEGLYGRIARAGSREVTKQRRTASKPNWRNGVGVATGLVVCLGVAAALRFGNRPPAAEGAPPPRQAEPASMLLIPLGEDNGEGRPIVEAAPLADPRDRAEAQARLALHDAGLSVSVLIEVKRDASNVTVWGVVPNSEIRQGLVTALSGQPVVVALRTEAEQQTNPQALPWRSFQGDAPPLAAERLHALYPTNSPARQQLQNTLDGLTRELTGLAGARQALLRLAASPGLGDSVEAIHRASDEMDAEIARRRETVAASLRPLLGETMASPGPLSRDEADRLYLLVHDLVFLSRSGSSLSLDETAAQIRFLLERRARS